MLQFGLNHMESKSPFFSMNLSKSLYKTVEEFENNRVEDAEKIREGQRQFNKIKRKEYESIKIKKGTKNKEDFKIGQYVLLKKIATQNDPKLSPRRLGPFTITRLFDKGATIKHCATGFSRSAHYSRIKEFPLPLLFEIQAEQMYHHICNFAADMWKRPVAEDSNLNLKKPDIQKIEQELDDEEALFYHKIKNNESIEFLEDPEIKNLEEEFDKDGEQHYLNVKQSFDKLDEDIANSSEDLTNEMGEKIYATRANRKLLNKPITN